MSLLQIVTLIFATYIHETISVSVIKTIQPNGEIWLQQSGANLIPSQATSYNNISLGQIMSIEFDFIFNGRTNPPPQTQQNAQAGYEENFFRIGYESTNRNCDGEKSSYPAMFLTNYGVGDMLDIKVSSGTTCPGSTNGRLEEYGNLTIGINHHIKISFNDTQVVVDITGGGKIPFAKHWARDPTPSNYLGDALNVYFLSDTYYTTPYNRGDAIFNNIIIKSSNMSTFAPTFAPTTPTINPTHIPTHIPTNTPTQTPTNNPTITPTLTPTNNPTLLPTDNPSHMPTKIPTIVPTHTPTITPTLKPSKSPTFSPTFKPTIKLIVRDSTANPTMKIYRNESVYNKTGGLQQTIAIVHSIEKDNESFMYVIIIISVATFVMALAVLFTIELCVKRYKNKKEGNNKPVPRITPIRTDIAPIHRHIQLNTTSPISPITPQETLFPPTDMEMIIRSDSTTMGNTKRNSNVNKSDIIDTNEDLTTDKPKLQIGMSDSELLYGEPGIIHITTTPMNTPIGEDV